jgi:hypothetical protein
MLGDRLSFALHQLAEAAQNRENDCHFPFDSGASAVSPLT